MTKYDIKCARRSLAETDDVISPENTTLATNYSFHKGHTFTVARSIYTPVHKSEKKHDKNKSDNETTRGERERKKFSRQNVQSSLMVLNVTKRPLRKQPSATSSQCRITLCCAFYSMWGHIWPYYTVAPFDNWWKNNQWPCSWTKAYCRQYYLAYWWLSRHWKIMFFFLSHSCQIPVCTRAWQPLSRDFSMKQLKNVSIGNFYKSSHVKNVLSDGAGHKNEIQSNHWIPRHKLYPGISVCFTGPFVSLLKFKWPCWTW